VYQDSNDDTQFSERYADDEDGDVEDAADSERDSFSRRPLITKMAPLKQVDQRRNSDRSEELIEINSKQLRSKKVSEKRSHSK